VRELQQDQVRRVGELEQKLQEAFNLLGAIVIESVPASGAAQGKGPAPTPGDLAHALLGCALAGLIATGAVFRDLDCIGLGSGRGVYYTVEALAKLPRLRAANVTIVSLTGDVYAQDHAKIIDSKMDADMHARLFSLAFAGKVHRYLMGSRILYSDATILEAVRNRTWSDPQWPKITHALVGVGALTAGHRFFDEITTSHPEPILAPVHAELKELVSLSKKISAGTDDTYCPVADISNNLFFVRPPSGVSIQTKSEHRIRELISSINPRLLNVPEAVLKETGTILLVAGTKKKALAIRELLTSEPYRIRFLCTDRDAAEIVLKEVEG
jgi:DNA-binding transcriptional regulator LsrR (DeoR family)